jgi:hypothetical protein
MKNVSKRSGLKLCVLGLLLSGTMALADGTNKTLEMTFSVRNGTGDEPMIAVWLENTDGDFIKTIQLFSKKSAYYKDLLAWRFKSKSNAQDAAGLDAVTGATIKWKKAATISVPVKQDGHDLLDGTYVLRIESRKDKGSHYRDFKIPLTKDYKGGKHEDAGYVESVEISIKDKAAGK